MTSSNMLLTPPRPIPQWAIDMGVGPNTLPPPQSPTSPKEEETEEDEPDSLSSDDEVY